MLSGYFIHPDSGPIGTGGEIHSQLSPHSFATCKKDNSAPTCPRTAIIPHFERSSSNAAPSCLFGCMGSTRLRCGFG
jgi:hypothetical protein